MLRTTFRLFGLYGGRDNVPVEDIIGIQPIGGIVGIGPSPGHYRQSAGLSLRAAGRGNAP